MDHAKALIECTFTFKCPKEWGNLRPTDMAGVRYCDACKREVFLVSTSAELKARAARGDCVAVPGSTADRGMVVGGIEAEYGGSIPGDREPDFGEEESP